MGESKEEISAICVVALSLVDAKIYNPNSMMDFMHQQVGIDRDEVYYKMHNLVSEMPLALSVVKSMQGVEKKRRIAAFFAAAIKAVGYANDEQAVESWLNCVKYLLLLSDGDDCDFSIALERYENNPKTNE